MSKLEKSGWVALAVAVIAAFIWIGWFTFTPVEVRVIGHDGEYTIYEQTSDKDRFMRRGHLGTTGEVFRIRR